MKSHALSYLIGLVEENGIEAPKELSEADVLSPWAVEFRYEGDEPPALDRPAALTTVEQVRAWAENELEDRGSATATSGRTTAIATQRRRRGRALGPDITQVLMSHRSLVLGFTKSNSGENGEGGIRTRDGV